MQCARCLAAILWLAVACPAWSSGYHYIPAEKLYHELKRGASMILIDVSPATLFAQRHIPGSIGTQAYPVKTATEKERLDKVLPTLDAAGDAPIVIICPRGGQSAQRAFDHLKTRGVSPRRMSILAGGILAWPHTASGPSQ